MPSIYLNGVRYTGSGAQYNDTEIKNNLQNLTVRVDTIEADKANSADVYTKGEIDDKLLLKSDAMVFETTDIDFDNEY